MDKDQRNRKSLAKCWNCKQEVVDWIIHHKNIFILSCETCSDKLEKK